MREANRQPSRKKTTHVGPVLLILICVILILTTVSGGLLARYITQNSKKTYAQAADFQFTSDYLTESNPTFIIYGTSVDFVIRNHDKASTTGYITLYYDFNIDKGSFTAKADDGTASSGTAGTDYEYSLAGGVPHNVTYTLTGNVGDQITVTAKSTSPYTKTIKATFVFESAESTTYTINDGGNYVQVDLYTGSASDLIVNFAYDPNKLYPDKTNTVMEGLTSGGALKGLEANKHYVLIFFKADDTKYTNITVLTSLNPEKTISFTES